MAIFGHSVTRPTVASVPLGILASEQGHLLILAQLLNLRRVWNHHSPVFSTWYGRAAIIVNLLSFATLLNQLWAAISARRAFTEAIKKSGIQPRAGSTLGSWHHVLSLLPVFALATRGKTLKVDRNIEYANIKKIDPDLLKSWEQKNFLVQGANVLLCRGRVTEWLSLDVMRVANGGPNEKKRPVLLSIHGGAWLLGDKGFLGLASAMRIASRGIIVVMANYRMAPETTWPAPILDAKRALVYVKQHAEEWGGDPNKVFVCGESAGGHLSALLGCTPNLPEYQPPELANTDTSVRVVFLCMGFTTSPGRHRRRRSEEPHEQCVMHDNNSSRESSPAKLSIKRIGEYLSWRLRRST